MSEFLNCLSGHQRIYPDFPIWTYVSRIICSFYPGHKKVVTRAGPLRGRGSSEGSFFARLTRPIIEGGPVFDLNFAYPILRFEKGGFRKNHFLRGTENQYKNPPLKSVKDGAPANPVLQLRVILNKTAGPGRPGPAAGNIRNRYLIQGADSWLFSARRRPDPSS